MTNHTITRRKVDRGPHLTAHFIPTCTLCGPVAPASDLDDAKRAGEMHVAQVAHERVVGEVADA